MHDLAVGLAWLVIVASFIGLTRNSCGHAACEEVHKRERARDLENLKRAEHDRYHDADYPNPSCQWCRR